jgi:hypothetical protein
LRSQRHGRKRHEQSKSDSTHKDPNSRLALGSLLQSQRLTARP